MAALGVETYLLPKSSPHPFNRRALRVSMGYAHKLKTHVYEDILGTIKALKLQGYRVYAAEVTADSTPLSKLNAVEKWALVMGHEGRGIAEEILKECDEVVTIEMQEGIKSFNVGVAASIMMYQLKNTLLSH
jgi:tRNA G18 (ribose-2'-O)-methylase SpoU